MLTNEEVMLKVDMMLDEEHRRLSQEINKHELYLRVVGHTQWIRQDNDRLEDLLRIYRDKLIEEARLEQLDSPFDSNKTNH